MVFIRVHLDKKDPLWSRNMTLRVHSNAHVLHAYVNGKYVGNQFVKDGKFDYKFERKVNLVHGTNHISLLSVSVGLQVRCETIYFYDFIFFQNLL